MLWDCVLAHGKRVHFTRAFYSTDFSGEVLPRTVYVKSTNYMFYDYRGTMLPLGLDFSNCSTTGTDEYSAAFNLFGWATELTEIYDIKLPVMAQYRQTFAYLRKCKTIGFPIKVHANTVFKDAFFDARGLENITFEGVIGQNGLDLHWSTKLTADSIRSLINALSAETTGLTVTLSQAAREAAFTDEEWAALIATKPNWTISLV